MKRISERLHVWMVIMACVLAVVGVLMPSEPLPPPLAAIVSALAAFGGLILLARVVVWIVLYTMRDE